MTEPNFDGHAGRECGEHRTTGQRAWCHGCSEWCYPDSPCKGCELPQLHARVAALESAGQELVDTIDRADYGDASRAINNAADDFRAVLRPPA